MDIKIYIDYLFAAAMQRTGLSIDKTDGVQELLLALTTMLHSPMLDSEKTAVIAPLVADVVHCNYSLQLVFQCHGWDSNNNCFTGPIDLKSVCQDIFNAIHQESSKRIHQNVVNKWDLSIMNKT